MDYRAVQEIIALVSQTGLAEVELEDRDFKLRIRRYAPTEAPVATVTPVQLAAAPAPVAPVAPQPVVLAPATVAPVAPQPEAKPAAEPAALAANLHTIHSPMIGTFYRSSGPDKDAFVKVGDTITPGQTLCIVEAMKLFNEIESEVSGKIVKILVENANPVEYDQPLFLVELS